MDQSATPPSSHAERWLPVVGWEGLYMISDQGNVRSLQRSFKPRLRGDLLSPGASTGGRLSVVLYRSGERKTRLVHQMVLEAFAGPRPVGMEGCHGPGGHHDNRLQNLRWDTPSANQMDRVRDGTSNRGERQWQSKLTEAQVLECRCRYAAGETQQALAAEFGVNQGAMSQAISGAHWGWLPGAVPIDATRHGRQGVAHHSAKLTAEIVLECRARHANGETTYALAEEFGVKQPSMQKAITGKSWTHI